MKTKTARNPGMFRMVLHAYSASRRRQADRYVTGALLMLDDETLRAHGIERSDLETRASAILI